MHSRHQDHLTQTIKVKKKLPITKSAASNIFSTNPSGIFTGNSTQANTRLSNSFLDKLFIFTMFFFFLHIHKTQGSQWYFLTPVTNSKAKTLALIPRYSNSTKKTNKIPASSLGNLRPSDSRLWGSIKLMVAPDLSVPFSDVYWPQSNFSKLQQREPKKFTGMFKITQCFCIAF